MEQIIHLGFRIQPVGLVIKYSQEFAFMESIFLLSRKKRKRTPKLAGFDIEEWEKEGG
jgi:hypothetical protein